jgi:SAM-dependent methyltransferase
MIALLLLTVGLMGLALLVASAVLTAVHYPYEVDAPASLHTAAAREYYQDAYERSSAVSSTGRFTEEEEYVAKARAHAVAAGIPEIVADFAKTAGVTTGRALEVGAGSGLLQDTVQRYVGIDVSSRAKRFFHKPFVEASATALPFADDSFDAAWSIWVLEHVPNPEQALSEMRRVVRNGGCLLLRPAWDCDPWAAEGCEVRPYRDLSWTGRLMKASIPVVTSRWYSLLHSRQIRLLRTAITTVSGKPARLRFKRLTPNYEKYWVTDSDAVVSLDYYEMYLWFTSRGDECLNVPSRSALLWGAPGRRRQELVIRIRK